MSCIPSVASFGDAETETLRTETGSSKPRFKPRKSGSRPNLLPFVVPRKGYINCRQLSCSEPQFSLL